MKLTNAYKSLSVPLVMLCFIHSMPPTCFGYTCVHPHGGALQTIGYKNVSNKCTNIPYTCSFPNVI